MLRPAETRAASEVDRQNATPNDLQPGVAWIDLGIGESHVAGIVAADESERHCDGTGHSPFGIDEIDAQIQRRRAPQAFAN